MAEEIKQNKFYVVNVGSGQKTKKDNITMECNVVNEDEMYNGIQIIYCTMILCFDANDKYEQSHCTDSLNIPYQNLETMSENEIEKIIQSYVKASKGYIQYIYFYSVSMDNIDKYIKQIQTVIVQKLIPTDDISKKVAYFQLIHNGYSKFENKSPFLCRTNQQTTNPFLNSDETKENDNKNKIYVPIVSKEYPNQIIYGKLYLGDIHQAYDEIILSNLKITHIINCSHLIRNQFENNKTMNIKYLKVNISDQDSFNIVQYFDITANFINKALKENKNNRILVHCHAGVSRSSTIVIAYVMRMKHCRFNEAFDFVKQKRQFINPNRGFKTQLKQFEKQLFSNTNPFLSEETDENNDECQTK